MTDHPAPYGAYTPRPTIYKGTQMRSRLEAGYAAWLDLNGWNWDYEPRAFAGADGAQYLPDFVIHGVTLVGQAGTRDAYVEVKPAVFRDFDSADSASLHRFSQTLRAMGTIHESDPDALLLLEAPEDDGLPYAETSIVEPDPYVGYWTFHAVWMHAPTPTIGRPMPRERGPWFAEWWRGQVTP